MLRTILHSRGPDTIPCSPPHHFLVDHKSLTNPDTASRPQDLCKTACNRHCLSLFPFLSIPSPPTFPFLSITPVYSQTCPNPYISVDASGYGLVQVMGYCRGPTKPLKNTSFACPPSIHH